MKTILVDAWNTFVTKDGVFQEMKTLLDSYQNEKIILTNANEEEKITYGIVNMPYKVFSLGHNPNKVDPGFYKKMLAEFSLTINDVVYFEHNAEAVESARSVGIETYHYDKDEKDLGKLKKFLDKNL